MKILSIPIFDIMLVICILREGLYMPEGINLFQDTLIKSLKFGFVDNIKYQEGGYSPQILVNNSDEKRYVLTDLQEELSKCTAFYFIISYYFSTLTVHRQSKAGFIPIPTIFCIFFVLFLLSLIHI